LRRRRGIVIVTAKPVRCYKTRVKDLVVSRLRLIAVTVALGAMMQGCSGSGNGTNDGGAGPSLDGEVNLGDAGADHPEQVDVTDSITDAAADIVTDDTIAPTLLQQVAAIVVPNCAVSGCHDAITMEHGMDLSTAARIHSAWVNQRGPDHCQNKALLRVVPGNPNGSYVMTKITATMKACELWDPMPPSPRAPLTLAQIETIRAWIQAGARLEAPVMTPDPSSR
jgi:hypothetical protein